jgi:hypothetical protein
MGLKRNYENDFGLDAPNAYYRIKDVRGDSEGNIDYNIEIYYDKAARDAGKTPLVTLGRTLPSAAASSFSVAYEIYQTIKADVEFSGAEDVYEGNGNFPAVNSQFILNGYILSGTLTSGNLVGGALTNAGIDGKILHGDEVITGNFSSVNAHNVTDDGYGNMSGFVDDGYADGYIVQYIIT